MALVDPNILRYRESPDLMGSFQRGVQMRGLLRADGEEQRKQERAKAFEQAFDQVSRGMDLTNPENMGNALKQTFQMFPDETMATARKYQEAFPQAKTQQDQWAPLPGAEVPTLYNPRTAETKVTGVAGKPAPVKPKNYQMVKNRKGVFEAIDPETGLNKEGKPVEAWIDPQSPRGEKALTGKDVFGMEQQLRTQYLGQTKDFRDVRDAFGRIKVSAKDPSAAGDLALIFNYMKMLDPGSTVRESEFATAAASGSLGDRFVAAGKKLLSGERLDPTQRADFLNRAQSLYTQQRRQMEKAKFETRKMASSYPGLNADRILMDADLAEEGGQATPTYEEYDSLPSGAEFTDPEGNVRRKP